MISILTTTHAEDDPFRVFDKEALEAWAQKHAGQEFPLTVEFGKENDSKPIGTAIVLPDLVQLDDGCFALMVELVDLVAQIKGLAVGINGVPGQWAETGKIYDITATAHASDPHCRF
jgi:ABC-type transporter Mla MlaB component